MCCIFTCCGWMIDLVQRLWTFAMACCISSSVCCLLVVCSMSGVALGYNYSLAEYMELRETNVSIYMKRGVFDDEISDMEWRRAGHIPPRSPEESNLRMGGEAEKSSTVRSGRRLDDSVVDTGDRIGYEGSLIKLTAKPPVDLTGPPQPTADIDMNKIARTYTKDSLDSMKAIQSLIDARKSMAKNYGLSTLSPVATYPFNEVPFAYEMGSVGGPGYVPGVNRRMMEMRRNMQGNQDVKASLSPARLAVPGDLIGEPRDWILPKHPEMTTLRDKYYGLYEETVTLPTPITIKTGPIRPTPSSSEIPEEGIYMTNYRPFTLYNKASTDISRVAAPAKDPSIDSFKERLMLVNEMPPKRTKRPNPDEDYDYAIKGLPVRRRRSIDSSKTSFVDAFFEKNENSSEIGLIAKVKKMVKDSKIFENLDLATTTISIKELFIPYKIDMVQHKNQIQRHNIEDNIHTEINNTASIQDADKVNKLVFLKKNPLYDHKTETPDGKIASETIYDSKLVSRLISKLDDIKKTFYSLAGNEHRSLASKETYTENYKDTVQPTHNLFVTKIVSSNYNNPVSIAGFGTKVTSMEDLIPNEVVNMETIKSTPSVLVKMLVAAVA